MGLKKKKKKKKSAARAIAIKEKPYNIWGGGETQPSPAKKRKGEYILNFSLLSISNLVSVSFWPNPAEAPGEKESIQAISWVME